MIDIENLKKEFPVGSRVELIKMDDKQAPPIGTKGTVLGVDDIGSIMVAWDNGSSLNVVYGVDKCEKLNTVKTICYGKEQIWDKKEEGKNKFIPSSFLLLLFHAGKQKKGSCR